MEGAQNSTTEVKASTMFLLSVVPSVLRSPGGGR